MSVAFETPAVEVVTDLRSQVGESPLWSVAERALWWVDIEGRLLHRLDPAAAETTTWPVDERIGCIGLHRAGGFVAALETGIFRLDPQPGGRLVAERLARVVHPQDGMRFNDGRVDRSGRFWSATMVRDMSLGAAVGALYRFDGRGLSAPLVPGLATGNGLAFSPDGRHALPVRLAPERAEDLGIRLAADGTLAHRRRLRRHGRTPRPSRRCRGRCRRLLLDLRDRRRCPAPLHAAGPARPRAAAAGDEADDVRVRRPRSRRPLCRLADPGETGRRLRPGAGRRRDGAASGRARPGRTAVRSCSASRPYRTTPTQPPDSTRRP